MAYSKFLLKRRGFIREGGLIWQGLKRAFANEIEKSVFKVTIAEEHFEID